MRATGTVADSRGSGSGSGYGSGAGGTSYGSGSIRPATSYVDPNPNRSNWSWYPWGYANRGSGLHVNFGFACSSAYSWWYWPYYLTCYTPYRYHYFYHPRFFGFGANAFFAYDNNPQVIYVDSSPEVVYVENQPDVVYVESEGEPAAGNYAGATPLPESAEGGAGEAVAAEGAQDRLTIASERYLNLGDQAFREGRYGDAVHFYARAVEFTPDVGVLYMILADALFATGDYHYAAYAVRRALDLDPTLVDSIVDKHSFYGDPSDFDRQLAVLVNYVSDHPLDPDAALLLGLNYLFGAQPEAAARLLRGRAAESGELRGPESLVFTAAERALREAGESVPSGQ